MCGTRRAHLGRIVLGWPGGGCVAKGACSGRAGGVAPARVMARLTVGRRRRLAGVGGLHLLGVEGGVPGTTCWLGLALGDVGISGDGDLGYSIIGSSSNGTGSSSNAKGGGGVGALSLMMKWYSSAGAVGTSGSGDDGE